MDKLEKYINNARESFDSATPSDALWDKINSQIETRQEESNSNTRLVWMITKMAAAFAVVLASGVVIGYYINAAKSHSATNDAEFQNYIDVEKQYVKDINHKMNALRVHDVDPQVNSDLMQLDEVYQELKLELHNGQAINNDRIIESLLRTHQAKVEILEKVLSRIQKNRPEELELKTLRNDSISL